MIYKKLIIGYYLYKYRLSSKNFKKFSGVKNEFRRNRKDLLKR